ncbi:hypothetical protein EVAR_43224_1 [Eumeta japonica]|uniref:Uncharacterized protein n=1 Tax=Eumeta variegata TaxID=151549 RepID=A0A4C1WVD3_EUMVA|nr:hypothetical protein EVAR_43224_1 [Eumeta japonica]
MRTDPHSERIERHAELPCTGDPAALRDAFAPPSGEILVLDVNNFAIDSRYLYTSSLDFTLMLLPYVSKALSDVASAMAAVVVSSPRTWASPARGWGSEL